MLIIGDTIIFRSEGSYFFKERDNQKCNTLRRFDDWEELKSFKENRNELKTIRIWSSYDGYFERELTDITKWEGYYIFSWKPAYQEK